MRRITFITTLLVVFAITASLASAKMTTQGTEKASAKALAPMAVPTQMPAADTVHDGAYGFATSGEIAETMNGGAEAVAATSSTGSSATVTVTATVLPSVILVVDDHGDLQSIVTNTPERDAGATMFVVRSGSADGDAAKLDKQAWDQARAALKKASAGSGTIWSR